MTPDNRPGRYVRINYQEVGQNPNVQVILNMRQRAVFNDHFGIEDPDLGTKGGQRLTFTQIADKWGIDVGRIRFLNGQAIRKVRHYLRDSF